MGNLSCSTNSDFSLPLARPRPKPTQWLQDLNRLLAWQTKWSTTLKKQQHCGHEKCEFTGPCLNTGKWKSSWWFQLQPLWKNVLVKMGNFFSPNFAGMKIPKPYLSCHHPVKKCTRWGLITFFSLVTVGSRLLNANCVTSQHPWRDESLITNQCHKTRAAEKPGKNFVAQQTTNKNHSLEKLT